MKYSLKTAEIVSLIIACTLGVLFHFVYDWSGENPIAGLFFPVNESTWEHLKLIFFPILLLAIAEYFLFGSRYETFICVKLVSALLGMGITVVLFYTYTGIYGKNSDVTNILIYFISMISAYRFSFYCMKNHKRSFLAPSTCYLGFFILTLLFALFTIFPPEIGIFTPPDAG